MGSFEQSPSLAQRCEDFSADRGLDSGGLKAMLWDDYGIRPVIDIRELWREEKNEPGYDPQKPITRAWFADRVDTIVYTEKGTLHCICPVTGEQRDMTFQGFEAGRNTLKYRCPAAAGGFQCQGHKECSAFGQVNPGAYGRSIRINITKEDRRIFTPTPMAARAGKGFIIGAHLWNGSIIGSTTASDLKSIISVAKPRCRPELV